MKEVIRFESNDGKVFDTPDECIKHEQIKEIAAQMRNDGELYERDCCFEDVVKWLLQRYKLTELSKVPKTPMLVKMPATRAELDAHDQSVH